MLIFKKTSFLITLLLSLLFFSACESKTEKQPIVEEVKPIAVNVHTLKKEEKHILFGLISLLKHKQLMK